MRVRIVTASSAVFETDLSEEAVTAIHKGKEQRYIKVADNVFVNPASIVSIHLL